MERFNLLNGRDRSGLEMIRIALRAGRGDLNGPQINLKKGTIQHSGPERKRIGSTY